MHSNANTAPCALAAVTVRAANRVHKNFMALLQQILNDRGQLGF